VGLAPEEQAAPIASPIATIRLLLAAYAETLKVINALPAMPMVATRWHWWSRSDAPIRIPRVSWMLRSLTVWHIDRVLDGAERVFRRRSALGIAEEGEADALTAVAEFRASLPSRSRALRLGVLSLATLVLARLLATLLPHLAGHARIRTATALDRLFDSTLGALQFTATSIGSALAALFTASPAALAAAAALLIASLYLILRPVSTAFRLKRLLLNLYPHAESMRSETPASWSVTRSTGVYRLEQKTFAAFDARCPSEPPLDLLVCLTMPIALIAVCVLSSAGLADVSTSWWSTLALVGFVLVFYGTPAGMRLAWLAAAWRARQGSPRSGWLLADDVSVSWRTKPVRCRSPVLICWLSFMYPFTYVLAWLPWWSTARDLRDLGRAHGVKPLQDIRPAAQAFAVGPGVFCYGILPLIMLLRAPRYIREAQMAIGLEQPVSRQIAWLAPIWPVLCLLLQRELNRLWQAEGSDTRPFGPVIDPALPIDAAPAISQMVSPEARPAGLDSLAPVGEGDGERGESVLPQHGPDDRADPGRVEGTADHVQAP
jgi:hypothetical protein